MNRDDNPNAAMSEPGRHSTGASTGGMAHTADQGIANAMQQAATANDQSAPDSGSQAPRSKDPSGAPTQAHPGAMPSTSARTGKSLPPSLGFEDENEEDDVVPKALPDSDEPRRETAAQSLGRSISQIITGGTHVNEVEEDPAKKAR